MAKRFNSVAKGNRNERVLAGILSDWSGVPLRKTPRDGDWAKAMYPGDVIPTIALNRQQWPFSFEAKDLKTFDLDSSLMGRKTGFTELMDYTLDRCETSLPVLIAKGLRKKHIVFSPVLPEHVEVVMMYFHKVWWYILPLDQFVKIPFEEMVNVANEYLSNGKRPKKRHNSG